MASAEVQMRSSGTSRPEASNRADRSRGVKMELLVKTRYSLSLSRRACRNSAAPGIALVSCTSTPSMSVSQYLMGFLTGLISFSRSSFVPKVASIIASSLSAVWLFNVFPSIFFGPQILKWRQNPNAGTHRQ